MDASAISNDSYGNEALQVAVMKKSQDANADMALKLVQDTVQSTQQVNANAAGANPGDRLGQHINIAV